MMMDIKFRLTIMSFMQFFVWGAWLITIGNYWFITKQWGGAEFGAIFSTLGISSIIMPALTGILADKWINGERLYGVLHLFSGISIACLPLVDNPIDFYWVILMAMLCYMPTIALSNSVAYRILKDRKMDVIKLFPSIRVWGTIGFIVAMWVTNLSGNKASAMQFYISALGSFILALYSFTLPACKPEKLLTEGSKFVDSFGLRAFQLFNKPKFAIFFVFSMFLGAALQLTNMYGDTFISDFSKIPEYADSLVVKYSTIIMSISQMSETLFILTIPFFLRKYGIKKVMLMSMLAWVLRFGLFSFGNPSDGLWMIVLSGIVYGMAFDFFNISGSLFIETNTSSQIRASAQGMFMMMTNGFGAFFGAKISGWLIDVFFSENNARDWHFIWLSFAGYALIVSVAFAVLFKHKHKEGEVFEVPHS